MNKALTSDEIDKAIRLLEYHIRLASLRAPVVRDITRYEKVLWVKDIPMIKGCFAQAWGRNEAYDIDVWMEVQSRREPQIPHVPEICYDWINFEQLNNDNDLPELKQQIQVSFQAKKTNNFQEDIDESTVAGEQYINDDITLIETRQLVDFPEVYDSWQAYLNDHWIVWSGEHRDWKCINRIYSDLFAIHQEQLRLGEEYELVIGLGLLNWKARIGQIIRRHMVVANAMLDFDSKPGRFTIRPSIDGASLRPELDMFDLDELPNRAEDIIKSSLESAEDDPWEKEPVDAAMTAFVHSLHAQGEYRTDLGATTERVQDKPIIEFAPAIILRKRSAKGLTNTLLRIKEEIINTGVIPPEFQDLSEIGKHEHGDREHDSNIHSVGRENSFEGEVYFTKPSNTEQHRIIEKIQGSTGVLVQGPPGTGKSHTIANLISHFLATGQRILVTAKTPRALQVLEEQIPIELRPLCINLLGNGLDEKRSMESSVSSILIRNGSWIPSEAEKEVLRLQELLEKQREEKAVAQRHLRELRESETHAITIVSGEYRGTRAEIAQKVNQQRVKYEWFIDKLQPDALCLLDIGLIQETLKQLQMFSVIDTDELRKELPINIITPEMLRTLLVQIKGLEEKTSKLSSLADANIVERFLAFPEEKVRELVEILGKYISSLSSLLYIPQMWIKGALSDIVTGGMNSWIERYKVTNEAISEIEPYSEFLDNSELQNPDSLGLRSLSEHVSAIKDHLKNGGKINIFMPGNIKEHMKALKNIRFNGVSCSSIDVSTKLLSFLKLNMILENAWHHWSGLVERTLGPVMIQISALKELCKLLLSLQNHEKLLILYKQRFVSPNFLYEPVWSSTISITKTVSSAECAVCMMMKNRIENQITSSRSHITEVMYRNNSHQIVATLIKAIDEGNCDDYSHAAHQVGVLIEKRNAYHQMLKRINSIKQDVPLLMEALESTCTDSVWDVRLIQLREAWNWAQADARLRAFIVKENAIALSTNVKLIEDDILRTIAVLASLLAWTYCFKRLKEPHRRHMEAWQQSMKKVGKGTGKHAPRHRREAQGHLNECREAVPGWIMPLHRIWDTVDPAPGIFDVIIVDEASQCGFEALPLYYLGKRILIVGDDKQISPDAVGVSRDAVQHLKNEYLHDFEFSSTFDIENSLFDHAKVRYGTQQITLREHFRCMPEIIRFSNKLCYAHTPLIPLRQYGPDRLQPLEHVFIETGHREGIGSRVINTPEAKAIVNRITEMCKDIRYDKKTMGVVILQGEAQGNLIEDMLLKTLGAEEFQKRKLVCGNPYSFQGDQRNIILLSMVAAPNEKIGAYSKDADMRRFNVAASRAQDQMILYHSVKLEDLSTHCLRYSLLEFFEEPEVRRNDDDLQNRLEKANHEVVDRRVEKPPHPFDSWFEVDVALYLMRKGYDVIPQHEVAGKRIDMVVEGGVARFAVECDGDHWHGPDEYEEDMQRQRILERCNWEFFRVRASAYTLDKEKAMEKLWKLLETRGIYPYWASRKKLSFIDNMNKTPMPSAEKPMFDNGSWVSFDNIEKNNEEISDDISESEGDVEQNLCDEEDDANEAIESYDRNDQNLVDGGNGTSVPNTKNENDDRNESDEESRTSSRKPSDVTKNEMAHAIMAALIKCPNQSCTIDSMPTRVLKELSIITRGKPRMLFEKRVIQILDVLDRQGDVEKYRAKNRRVRLLRSKD